MYTIEVDKNKYLSPDEFISYLKDIVCSNTTIDSKIYLINLIIPICPTVNNYVMIPPKFKKIEQVINEIRINKLRDIKINFKDYEPTIGDIEQFYGQPATSNKPITNKPFTYWL